MDSVDAMLLMRMVERLLGLLSGALCVVLGYRLFINLPEKTDSSGKVVLPGGVSIWLSRVGPGIFFALFGAAIVAYSFASTVRVTNEQNVPRASSDTPGEALAMRRQEIAAMSPRAAQAAAGEKALIELRGALADLNATIDKLTRDVSAAGTRSPHCRAAERQDAPAARRVAADVGRPCPLPVMDQ